MEPAQTKNFAERTKGIPMKPHSLTPDGDNDKAWLAEPKLRRSEGWPPECRAAQAARIRALQPWTKSTGPKTAEGKRRSRANAVKHNMRSAEAQALRQLLKRQRQFIRELRFVMAALEFPCGPPGIS
jgi:hypothetical protein